MRNIYLTPFLLIIFLFTGISCNSKNFKQNNKAQKEYLLNIEIIEKFIVDKGTSNSEILDSAILFMETVTNIKSDFIPGYEITLVPNEKNLKDWKDWYKKNKKRLYWDENEQKVKVK